MDDVPGRPGGAIGHAGMAVLRDPCGGRRIWSPGFPLQTRWPVRGRHGPGKPAAAGPGSCPVSPRRGRRPWPRIGRCEGGGERAADRRACVDPLTSGGRAMRNHRAPSRPLPHHRPLPGAGRLVPVAGVVACRPFTSARGSGHPGPPEESHPCGDRHAPHSAWRAAGCRSAKRSPALHPEIRR